jgi:GTPase
MSAVGTPADMETLKEKALADGLLRGDRMALARAISVVENGGGGASRLLERIGRRTGHAFVVGITGPPGTGKSTLVDRLIEHSTKRKLSVGVLAVDPSSPFTGGALLGDRIRMAERALDRSVFMRSMASRGWSGGLSAATTGAVQILDAAGFQIILIETVGIGQADIEVMGIAHAVVVVLMPGMGDDIQMSKAGLMEIGDIYAINKADLEGADQTLANMISFARLSRIKPPVLGVSASKDEGIDRLMDEIEKARSRFNSAEAGREMRLRGIRGMLFQLAKQAAVSDLEEKLDEREFLDLINRVAGHEVTLESAVRRLVRG